MRATSVLLRWQVQRRTLPLPIAVNPMVTDYGRNRAFTMFDGSAAARGSESIDETAKFDRRRRNFVHATRGIIGRST